MRLLHRLHLVAARGAHGRFERALDDPEGAQRRVLAATLRVLGGTPRWQHLAGASWETFVRRAPPTRWADLRDDLEAQRDDGVVRACPPTRRWQPTSGSTGARKWIPYPPALLAAFDEAAGAWLHDLARRHPEAFAGRHYWSLSWLPEALRSGGAGSDDRELLGPVKRLTLGRLMAVPAAVAELPSAEAALVATAAHLAAAEDLSLLSVWSPTFALSLLATLGRHREAVARWLRGEPWPWSLRTPANPAAAAALEGWDGAVDAAVTARLWPRLALISAWDGAAAAPSAEEVRALFPGAAWQGKGLWATEGVVTVPFRGRWPLALTAHVIELRCLATGRVLAPWAVETGQVVQPLITTPGGLVRYALADRLEVEGRLGRTPCLRFLGRLGGTDLVGEKLAVEVVEGLLRRLGGRATLWAVARPAHYALIVEGTAAAADHLARRLEDELSSIHHYRLARELGQLGPVAGHAVPSALALAEELARLAGRGVGEWKPEPLARWPVADSPEAVLARLGQRRRP